MQTAVDAKHHLIVEHEVTNNGSDRDQLSGMSKKARAAIGTTTLTAIADRGYFKDEEILACHEAGICALVPPTGAVEFLASLELQTRRSIPNRRQVQVPVCSSDS